MEVYQFVFIIIVLCAVHAKSGTKRSLRRPCDPSSRSPVTNVTSVILEPREVQAREKDLLSVTIINMRDGTRLVKRLKRSIYKELTKKSKRFIKPLERIDKGSRMTPPSDSSSVFKSFAQNLKLDHTAISKNWLYLKRFEKKTGGKKANRRWRRLILKLKRKNLEILCHLQNIVNVEGEELPPLPSFQKRVFPSDKLYERKLFEYKILKNMKSDLGRMISLYKHYRRHMSSKNGSCKHG